MSDEKVFTITKERILKGAAGCPTAEAALKSMFPEAFKDEWEDVTLDPETVRLGKHGGNGRPGFLVRDRGDGAWTKRPVWFLGLEPDRTWVWSNGDIFNFGDKFKCEDGRIWRRK